MPNVEKFICIDLMTVKSKALLNGLLLFAAMTLSHKIIAWYKKNKRELPFRNTKDAYKIWLSEIILQQTRVEQGLPYYNRFVKKFSNVTALANTKEETILKLWQGLGYYSRARNLHAAAKMVVSLHKGKFPESYNELIKLKGVGAYTAAAIASFAYNKPHAVVDGNVMRVLSRIFSVEKAVNTQAGKKEIETFANEILDPACSAIHNYALMELGALVCKPQNPLCSQCPVAVHCLAYKLKRQHSFPVKAKKQKVKHRYFYYLVIEQNRKLFLHKRTGNDIWKNLYDFPLVESRTKKRYSEILRSIALKKFVNPSVLTIKSVSNTYKHMLSHQTIFAVFIYAKAKKSFSFTPQESFIAVTVQQLKNKFALPRLIERYVTDSQL